MATESPALRPAAGASASPTTASGARPPARERLLAAADELFYGHGVHTVGIDRVLEHAGVSKATLYKVFGSKDALILAYLARRQTSRQERVLAAIDRYETPRERLLGVFDVIAASSAQPGFRGCAFINASAESAAGGTVEAASDESRAWLRALLTELSAAAGATDPQALGRQLALLYDGAIVAARMDRDPTAAAAARTIAGALLDAATPG